MAEYQLKSGDSKSYTVEEGNRFVGELKYKSWFSFNAEIKLADFSFYQVEPKGFWGTTIEVKKDGEILSNFKMQWSGSILVTTFFRNQEAHYIIKASGPFMKRFIVQTESKEELVSIQPDFKWQKFTYDYQINSTDTFEAIPQKDLLLVNFLHCANYFVNMLTTGAM